MGDRTRASQTSFAPPVDPESMQKLMQKHKKPGKSIQIIYRRLVTEAVRASNDSKIERAIKKNSKQNTRRKKYVVFAPSITSGMSERKKTSMTKPRAGKPSELWKRMEIDAPSALANDVFN